MIFDGCKDSEIQRDTSCNNYVTKVPGAKQSFCKPKAASDFTTRLPAFFAFRISKFETKAVTSLAARSST